MLPPLLSCSGTVAAAQAMLQCISWPTRSCRSSAEQQSCFVLLFVSRFLLTAAYNEGSGHFAVLLWDSGFTDPCCVSVKPVLQHTRWREQTATRDELNGFVRADDLCWKPQPVRSFVFCAAHQQHFPGITDVG